MNNACDNCLDLNSELKLKYNNIRQSGITKRTDRNKYQRQERQYKRKNLR